MVGPRGLADDQDDPLAMGIFAWRTRIHADGGDGLVGRQSKTAPRVLDDRIERIVW